MIIEQPPFFYRVFFRGAVWRKLPENNHEKIVYLTFDDGPIPEVTPWVLDILDEYDIKATFFCVGDNVRKHPNIYKMLIDKGHRVGNHTFNHLQGIKTSTKKYFENVQLASQYINSNLFRPPHGHIRRKQYKVLSRYYQIIMWDVVTRDYSNRLTSEKILANVKKYTRNGSIIVFHDSLKSEPRLKIALPQSIEWLKEQGYQFKVL